MGSIRRRNDAPEKPYEARYRNPSGKSKSKSFRTKAEARQFLAEIETDKGSGNFIDPKRGKKKFGVYAEEWIAAYPKKENGTNVNMIGRLNNHLLPAFGDAPLQAIEPAHIQSWVNYMGRQKGLSPATVKGAYFLLARILRRAAIDGYIRRSPCIEIELPREKKTKIQILELADVKRLAEAIDERFSTLIYTAAYTGLRWGELAALQRSDIDLEKRVINVSKSLSEINGHLEIKSTKTDTSRSVSLPTFLKTMLAEHMMKYPNADGYVFTSAGGKMLRRNFYRRNYKAAVTGAGLHPGTTFHALRHTCASILIAQGAHPKEIQERLGHSTIRLTFDRYGHLFPTLDERLREGLDAAFREVQG